MTTDNERTTRLQLRAQREDSGAGVAVGGYEDEYSIPRPTQGDEDAPWIKVPPFTSAAELLFENEPVPVAPGVIDDAYVASPPVEVADMRVLALYLQYTATDVGQLSIVPEVRRGLGGIWIPIGVLDLTPTVVVLGPPFGAGFISRPVAAAELRFPALAAPGTISLALEFPVGGFEAFRFSFADLDAAATDPTLTAHFGLSQ